MEKNLGGKMKKNQRGLKSCMALLLFTSAVASQAATISFTSTLTEGDITTTTSGANTTAPVSVLQGDFSILSITGVPDETSLFLPLTYTPDVLTVTGSVPGLSGLAASSTLLTIDFSANGLTANTTGTGPNAFVLNPGAVVTSIVISPTLLADLGLTGTTFRLSSFSDTGAAQGTALNSFTSSNPSLVLTSMTPNSGAPEPGSLLTMFSGLALCGLGLVGRKRVAAKHNF